MPAVSTSSRPYRCRSGLPRLLATLVAVEALHSPIFDNISDGLVQTNEASLSGERGITNFEHLRQAVGDSMMALALAKMTKDGALQEDARQSVMDSKEKLKMFLKEVTSQAQGNNTSKAIGKAEAAIRDAARAVKLAVAAKAKDSQIQEQSEAVAPTNTTTTVPPGAKSANKAAKKAKDQSESAMFRAETKLRAHLRAVQKQMTKATDPKQVAKLSRNQDVLKAKIRALTAIDSVQNPFPPSTSTPSVMNPNAPATNATNVTGGKPKGGLSKKLQKQIVNKALGLKAVGGSPPAGMPQTVTGGPAAAGVPNTVVGGSPVAGVPNTVVGGSPVAGVPNTVVGGSAAAGVPETVSQRLEQDKLKALQATTVADNGAKLSKLIDQKARKALNTVVNAATTAEAAAADAQSIMDQAKLPLGVVPGINAAPNMNMPTTTTIYTSVSGNTSNSSKKAKLPLGVVPGINAAPNMNMPITTTISTSGSGNTSNSSKKDSLVSKAQHYLHMASKALAEAAALKGGKAKGGLSKKSQKQILKKALGLKDGRAKGGLSKKLQKQILKKALGLKGTNVKGIRKQLLKKGSVKQLSKKDLKMALALKGGSGKGVLPKKMSKHSLQKALAIQECGRLESFQKFQEYCCWSKTYDTTAVAVNPLTCNVGQAAGSNALAEAKKQCGSGCVVYDKNGGKCANASRGGDANHAVALASVSAGGPGRTSAAWRSTDDAEMAASSAGFPTWEQHNLENALLVDDLAGSGRLVSGAVAE
eukprot:TRINITY_DN2412_c0_g1_i2.p1 TRINITY_DN2412_c0_g1~~TRINITY_DN2412_c0_g1_i2.p1  ORF type:complete len:758 (-),score=202.08 TRINITY_DN2412_c0_g1_i2:372-2645(-)